MMSDPEVPLAGMRVAIVGLGRMGRRHVEATRRLGMVVCGISDRSADSVEAARREHGLNEVADFSDARAMLKAVRPEAVVVATTAPSHAELVIAAVENGVRFILCEKPMGVSISECRRMVEACQGAGAVLAINHQMRFMPQYTEVRALVGGDELGPLSSILVAGSNFGLAMNASHYFEMFRYMTGQQVDTIQAWFDSERVANPRGAEFEDRAGRLLARTDTGPSMYIDFAARSGYGLQVVYICRNGQIVVDELNGSMQVVARQAAYRDQPTTRYGLPADRGLRDIPPADTIEPTVGVWRAMAMGEGYPDGAVGLHALSCLVAAHESDEAGGMPVRLDRLAPSEQRVFPWA